MRGERISSIGAGIKKTAAWVFYHVAVTYAVFSNKG